MPNDIIDIDSIIREYFPAVIYGDKPEPYISARKAIKAAIHQALLLASEKATVKTVSDFSGDHVIHHVDPKSILSIEQLIK